MRECGGMVVTGKSDLSLHCSTTDQGDEVGRLQMLAFV